MADDPLKESPKQSNMEEHELYSFTYKFGKGDSMSSVLTKLKEFNLGLRPKKYTYLLKQHISKDSET